MACAQNTIVNDGINEIGNIGYTYHCNYERSTPYCLIIFEKDVSLYYIFSDIAPELQAAFV